VDTAVIETVVLPALKRVIDRDDIVTGDELEIPKGQPGGSLCLGRRDRSLL
jgi:hypothetical protein